MSDRGDNGPITIAVMAGGESRRMGRDKALVNVEGRPLLQTIAGEALATGLSVVVVGRTPGEMDSLASVRFVADEIPGRGPLGGLATALASVGGPVLAVACDMPRLRSDAFLWLLESYRQTPSIDGLVTTGNGRDEPLFSIYVPGTLRTIHSLLESGMPGLKHLIAAGTFERIEAPGWVRDQLVNVNTPQDLELLRTAFGTS